MQLISGVEQNRGEQMEIKLNDGKTFEVLSYQKNSFELMIPFKRLYDTAVLMDQKNVSNARIVESSIGKENVLYQFKTVKMLGFETKMVDDSNVSIRFAFEEIPATEMELAQLRAKMELQRNVFLIGMNHANPEDVIRLCDELEEWKKIKFPYRKGERFKHNHKPYECLIDHTSDVAKPPDKSPALYKEVTKENKPKYPEWTKDNEYNAGDIVIHKGILWECTWNNNVREPSELALGWKKK